MLAKVSERELYIPQGDKLRKKSTKAANALAIELMHYGILPDSEVLARISQHKRSTAEAMCCTILKMYTIGQLNPPLFQNWEDRTEFTFEEMVIQIFGYVFQLSAKDLEDPGYLDRLKANIDFKKMKRLKLANSKRALSRFDRLVNSKVALDKTSQEALVALAAVYFAAAPDKIKSAEARIAVLIGLLSTGLSIDSAMAQLGCQAADALRLSAAKLDFAGVKLPSDVRYAQLKWAERVQLFSFLDSHSFEDLCETMGNNRQAWIRFLKHNHVFQQKDFRNRFTKMVAAAFVSAGSKLEGIPKGKVKEFVQSNSKFFDVTEGGNLAYRTFASRVQSAVDNQDFDSFKAEILKRPGHLLRNIGSMSRVCTKQTQGEFVELVRELIPQASAGILFSIIQIDVNAEYRIIDSKGNTTVTEANYHPVIGEVQGVCEREIYRRYGRPGKIDVAPELKNKVVPFLSTNAELDRGSRIPFQDAKFLYFLMHWVQSENRRTDLDHSYVCFDAEWNAETIYFGNQANSFIKQSGDITNAPAPEGGTEYGRIDLKRIPRKVRYIVPILNVFSGDVFSENELAYAGFMFSDSNRFSIKQEHTRYDLSQPANSNIPFVLDVQMKEIIIVDFNNRMRNGLTAHSSIGEIKKIVSALKSKKFMTIERFAQMLSGDSNETELTIKSKAKRENEIAPFDLQSLVS